MSGKIRVQTSELPRNTYNSTLKESTSAIERTLPLIECMMKKLGDLNLHNTLIISVQHLLSSTEVLFNALLQLQLDPRNLYVLGKCYSTDPRTLVQLRKKNINALFSSAAFNCSTPFDFDFERNIEEMLKQIVDENNLYSFQKIIILDDGGHLIEKVCQILPLDLPLVGIEQTSSGFNRLKDRNIAFPVINLARSWLKLEYESPLIIDLALRKLSGRLSKFKNSIKNVLLLGNGVLGKAVHFSLKSLYTVSIFDTLPEKSMISPNEFKRKLSEFDLIIGCTGATSLHQEDFRHLKRPVILASISSSDREFEAVELRKSVPNKNCHSNFSVDGITLLNGGFPITFDQDYDSIDTDEFQLTRALILASIYQAEFASPEHKGFISMDDNLQKLILNEMQGVSQALS